MPAWFEDIPLDFTRPETRAAERLIVTGYPRVSGALTLAEDVGLNLARLDQTARPAELVRAILKDARMSNRLVLLLAEILGDPNLEAIHAELRRLVAGDEATIAAAAMQRKPSLATLALLPSSLEVWPPGAGAAQALATPGLEKVINAAAGFSNPADFRLHLAEAEVRTARIDVGGKAVGTGFLVGDALLLTNWHVVGRVGVGDGAAAVFDNMVAGGGVIADKGRSVAFAFDWLVASSRHEKISDEISADGPPGGGLDFALVRLAEPAGAQAVGRDPDAPGVDRRGHYALDGGAYAFDAAEPLMILGHPAGRPVQFSFASPSNVKPTKAATRVRYQTNTEGGSSGSPVFNRDWRVVALHHAAGPTTLPGDFNLASGDFNQGVPIRLIVAALKAQLDGRPALAELGLA